MILPFILFVVSIFTHYFFPEFLVIVLFGWLIFGAILYSNDRQSMKYGVAYIDIAEETIAVKKFAIGSKEL
jgi:hypothetical protein